MHTNHTTNYELSQFVGSDKPTFLGDYNGDMQKIDTAIAGVGVTASGADSKADSAIASATAAANTAGDAANLANTANTNANSALTTAGNAATAASAAQSAASAVDTKVGALTDLTTTDKTTIVAAINEVNAKPSVSDAEDVTYDNTTSGLTATNVQAAIDELAAGGGSVDADDVAYDNTTSGLTATDVQAAIDELKALIPTQPEYITTGLAITENRANINDGGYYIDDNNICHFDMTITAQVTSAGDITLITGLPDCTLSAEGYVTPAFNNLRVKYAPSMGTYMIASGIATGSTYHFIGSYQIRTT